MGTGVTPDAREPVLEDAAGEKLVRDLRDLRDLRDHGRHEPYSRAKRSSYTVCSRRT